jgi:hypothetical protein
MTRARTRKRPCKICRRWFLPHPRQIGRQLTCSAECQKEHHRRLCLQWNHKNRELFKANYLSDKLERTKDPPVASTTAAVDIPASRIKLGLRADVVFKHTSAQQLVILEYLIEQIMQRVPIKSSLRPP